MTKYEYTHGAATDSSEWFPLEKLAQEEDSKRWFLITSALYFKPEFLMYEGYTFRRVATDGEDQ